MVKIRFFNLKKVFFLERYEKCIDKKTVYFFSIFNFFPLIHIFLYKKVYFFDQKKKLEMKK